MSHIARLLAGSVVLVVLYFSAALIGAVIPGRHADVASGDDVTIYLVAGPIHYDLMLPADADTRSAFTFLEDVGVPITHPDAAWVVVGWGSRAFYTATGGYQDLDVGTVWRAATGDTAVMRFDVLADIVAGPKTRALSVSQTQFATLRGVILQGIARDVDGQVRSVPDAGFTQTDVFVEATGRFSALRTCNVWIGETLRKAGVPMGIWTPTPYAVTLSNWWFH